MNPTTHSSRHQFHPHPTRSFGGRRNWRIICDRRAFGRGAPQERRALRMFNRGDTKNGRGGYSNRVEAPAIYLYYISTHSCYMPPPRYVFRHLVPFGRNERRSYLTHLPTRASMRHFNKQLARCVVAELRQVHKSQSDTNGCGR